MYLLCLFLLFIASPVFAQTMDLAKIIVVTPFRYEGELNKSASEVTVITQDDIKQLNVIRLVDALRSVPGIAVRDYTGNGTQVSVDMAGFGEQGSLNVLVLVDGRRINSVDLSGVDWSQIPLDRVERIEVIRGGAMGVLYGDNASSGVINIITKKGKGKPSGTLSVEFGSYAHTKQKLSLEGEAVDHKLSYLLSASRSSSNGYRHNSFDKDSDFASRLSYEVSDVLKVRFNSGFHASTYGMPGAVYQNNNSVIGTPFMGLQATIDHDGRRAVRFGNDHANNKDHYLLTGLDADFGDHGKFETDLSYRETRTDSYFLSSGLYTRKNKALTYGVTPKYALHHTVLDHDNKLVGGVDLYKTSFNSNNFDPADDKSLQNLTRINKTSFAGYVQDELTVLDPLVLVNGYRYEQARYTFNYHDLGAFNPDQDTKAAPKMQAYNSGLVYTYAEDSNVFLNAGKSFRFVQTDEFSYQDASFVQQLNTTLKPQTAMNYQLGLRHRFSPRLKSAVSLYRMNVRHELYFNAAGGPFGSGQNENYDRTVHQGLQLSADAKLTDKVGLFGNYTFTDAHFANGTYKDNQIPMVARHKASIGLKFLLSKDLAFNVIDNYVGSRYFLNDQANHYSRLNGYMTVDSNVSWACRDWTMTFGVNNILNKKYAETAGVRLTNDSLYGYRIGDKFYYPSPGTSVDLKMERRF